MKKKKKQIKVRKVPVVFLLECLEELYETGIEFVDVVAKKKKKGEFLGIRVNENYPCSEGPKMTKFDGKNINDLIV